MPLVDGCPNIGNMETGDQDALQWQIGVWDRISDSYVREVDRRFAPVVDTLLAHAQLRPGERVADLGTGTGAVAVRASEAVGNTGAVVGVDISGQMLRIAARRLEAGELDNVELREGRVEQLPAESGEFDVALASLSLMYVIDREAAARELGRILRPGGRFVGSVWAGPEECDIVRFQVTAGQFAETPPVAGVGPGSMADPAPFLKQLAEAGIDSEVHTAELGFSFPDFDVAWEVLAGVTTAQLARDRQEAARRAVFEMLYPDGDGPRHFRNVTRFIVGRREDP